MNIFADECVRLTFHEGTVSFCFESASSQYAGVTVHMPFAAFEAMRRTFAENAEGLAVAQANWLGTNVSHHDAGVNESTTQTPQDVGTQRAPMGPKFASVTADLD